MSAGSSHPALAAGVSALPHQVARVRRWQSAVARGATMNLGIPVLIPVAEPDTRRARRALARLHEIQPFLSSELRPAEAAVTLVPSRDHRSADLTVVAADDEMSLVALANAPGPAQETPAAIRMPATLIATADRAVLRLDVSHLVADAWSVRCLAEQFHSSYCGEQPAMADVDAFCDYLAERHARIAAARGTPRYKRLAELLDEAGSPYGYVQLDPLVPMSRRLNGGAVRLRRQVDGAAFRSEVRTLSGSPLVCMLGRAAYYCATLGQRDRAMVYFYLANREDRRTDNVSFWLASPSLLLLAGREVATLENCVEGARQHVYRCLREGDPVAEALHLTALQQGIDSFRCPSVWVTYGKENAADPNPAWVSGGFSLADEGTPVSYGRGRIDIDVTDRGDVVDVSLTAEAGRFDLPTLQLMLDVVSDFPSSTAQYRIT